MVTQNFNSYNYNFYRYSYYDVHHMFGEYVDVTTLKARWRRDRIRQLIGMNTVYLIVVCKLMFAFSPENIYVSAK